MAKTGTRRLIVMAAATAMLGLAGCSGSKPEATNEVEINAAAANVAATAAVPTPVSNLAENVTVNAAEALPPEKPVAADQQVMDDASATGMTSHVARDQDPDAPPPQN